MATLEDNTPKRGRRVPEILPPSSAAAGAGAEAPEAAEGEADAAAAKWYRVVRADDGKTSYEIPYGGTKVRMQAGKVISSLNYRVDDLIYAGVNLEPIEAPGWYQRLLERQAAKRSR